MSHLTIEQIQILMTAQGTQALDAAARLQPQALDVAAVERLRAEFPAPMVSAALTLSSLRLRARERFRLADNMFFAGADLLEQATSQPVAEHKARRFAGIDTVADLCCGAGGDALALVDHAAKVVAVDVNLAHLLCLRANAAQVAVSPRVWYVAADVTRWTPSADAYHIDPPRRDDHRRFRPDQCDQWIDLVADLVRLRRHVAGKLSPAVDLQTVTWADEVEFIAENGTLKQAVTWSGCLARHRRVATVLRSTRGSTHACQTIASDRPQHAAEPAGPLLAGSILHEPDPAVVRAGLLGNLAAQLDAGQVDPHLPLLVTDRPVGQTLLARSYEVLDILPWSVKRVRQLLRQRSWHVLEVKTRAFACQSEEILAGLKGLPREPEVPPVVLWAIRLGRKPVCLLTRRLKADSVAPGESPSCDS